MMIMLQVACLGLIVWVVLSEGGARWFEARTQKMSQVATNPTSDHKIDKIELLVRIGAVGVVLLIAVIGYFVAASVFVFILTGVTFAIFRGALAFLDRAAAMGSREGRLERVLKTPEFRKAPLALFFSAPDLNAPDHVRAWADELDQMGLPWFCMTAEIHHFAYFREQGRLAVRIPNFTTSLYHLPDDLRAILYVNNAQPNRKVIKALPELKHTQLLHGDSDKPPSYSPLTKNYDRVFVAGQMAIDRYSRNDVHIPDDRFRIVGRPQVAAIVPSDAKKRDGDVLQIVYMPTWRGFFEDTQFSSLDRADQILETIMELPEKSHVIFKPHPLSYKDPDWPVFKKRIDTALAKRAASGSTGEISPSELTPFDLYNRADVLICDISSVMIDFLYANKPLLTVLPQRFKPEDRANFPSLEACYNVSSDLQNLQAQLEAAVGEDPLEDERARVRAEAFGDLDQEPGAAFKAACQGLVED